jgi:hypothetical protein
MLQRTWARLLGRGRRGAVKGTIADALLQRDLSVGLRLATLAAGCSSDDQWRVVGVDVIQPPTMSEDGRRVTGPWSERWTVACGSTTRPYIVRFTPTSDGGTDWQVAEPDAAGA